MTIVYLPQKDGQWLNENTFAAYRGFLERGAEIRPYSLRELSEGGLPLTRETIVHGGIQQVHQALRQLKVPEPRYETYPHAMRKFMDRAPVEVRLADIIEQVQTPSYRPLFIKPSRDHKAFTGIVVKQFADLIQLDGASPDTWVYKMLVIDWKSEYRAFVNKGDLVGLKHYKGDPLVFPDPKVVAKMVAVSKSLQLDAFAIDVGVANFQERPEVIRTPTLMVEVNDGHSLGAYGLPSLVYAKMIEDRWLQMVS